VLAVAAEFALAGEPIAAAPYGSGHINDTFRVECRTSAGPRLVILQRINHHVFPRPDQLMANIGRVTAHLRSKILAAGGDPERETLTVIPTRAGDAMLQRGGAFWRAYVFILGARTYDVVTSVDQPRQAGRAFGRFQQLLSDLPGEPLHETIANFHHTPARFAQFTAAAEANVADRLRLCEPEVAFALGLEPLTHTVTDAIAAGAVPLRVTHNDTKINNVMLDDATGAGICVIDLDTVMPGSVLYDFGDQVRTSVGHFAENEQDLSKVYVDLDRYRALVGGYLETAGGFITRAERELLPIAGTLITFEIGLRFLADYLAGDVYFRTHRPHENLDRARTQFQFVRSMQAQAATLREIANP